MIRSDITVCVTIIIGTLQSHAQAGGGWTTTFPSPPSAFAEAIDVRFDREGNVYSLGALQNAPLLVKYDQNGDTLWSRQPAGVSGYPISLHVDSSNNPVFATSGHILKYDADGNLLWSRTPPAPMYTVAYDDYDNAWLGTADVLSWTVKKLDTNGDSLWQRKYASITYYPTESAADADGNCYFAGPYTAGAVQVVKYMPDGDTAWTSRYSRGGFFDQANAIATGPDGRVVVGGFSSLGFSPSDQDFFVMGLDSGGALAWEKHVDGPDADMDVVNSVDFDPEGNAYATGALTSSGELLVASMKLSPAGDSLWMTTGPEEPAVGARSRESAGATRSTVDGSTGLRGRIITDPFQFIDRTYAVFAQNRDRIGWIFYGALTGVAVTRNFLAGPPLGFTTIAGGGYISRTGAPRRGSASIAGTPGGEGVWVVMNCHVAATFPPASTLQTSVGVHLLSDIGPEERMPESFRLHQNYPNPFNPATVIRYELPVRAMTTLVIYDLLGREVARPVDRVEEPGARSVTWNAGSSPAGIYVYRMTSGAFRQSGKMVLLK